MTPTSVGLVLVVGHDADGETMDRDILTVPEGSGRSPDEAAAAVLRTEAMAANQGLRLHSIGVTWSEQSDVAASMLLRSLSESGFDNVVPIRMPEATEALARGIAEALGYHTTAVCVVEPDSVIALIVTDAGGGAVQTAFNHAIDSGEALVAWLSTVFTRADWEPEALVVVGSAADLDDALTGDLEDALSVPVFAPEEARLALARGAALASASSTEPPRAFLPGYTAGPREPVRRDRAAAVLARSGPAAMLGIGVVTFVVSVSIAVGGQLTPQRSHPAPRPVPAADARPAPVAAPPRPAPPPVDQVTPVEAIVDTPPKSPPADLVPADAAPVDAPPADAAPPDAGAVEGAPQAVPGDGTDVPPAGDPAPADVATSPAFLPTVPPVAGAPEPKVPLRVRIWQRLRGEPDPAAAPPADAPVVAPPVP